MERERKEGYEFEINSPFAQQFGIEVLESGQGYIRARVKSKKELENIYGDLHGGCLYAIADHMAGAAATTYGNYVTTINGSIQYLRAARDTEYVYCEAKVIKHGKTISQVHVEITDDGGSLTNTAEFTYFDLGRKLAF